MAASEPITDFFHSECVRTRETIECKKKKKRKKVLTKIIKEKTQFTCNAVTRKR